MKLLFVIKSLSLPGGGAERVLSEVSAGLARRGHDVTVLSFDPPDAPDFYPFDPAVRRVRSAPWVGSGGSRSLQTVRRIRTLRREVRQASPDVAIGFMHSAYIPLGLALAGTGIPLVASEHTAYKHYAGRPAERLLLRLSPWLARAITDPSADVRRGFPAAMRRKMTTIPNPVGVAAGGRADPAGPEVKTLLTVGGLREEKGHRTLIAAFGRIADRFPDWRLRIVGEGPLRPALEAQVAAAGLGGRIALPGATPEPALEYRRAQLFAMPSFYESFGLATAEAMAHGLPAIGFADCPGTYELIADGETGLLVHGADRVAALADGLSRLMASEADRVRMGAAAAPRLAPFAPERIVGLWEALVGEIRLGTGPQV